MLGMAPFSAGMKLFKTIANELKQADIEITTLDLKQIAGSDINAIKNAIFQLLGSDSLELAFYDCAIKSTIDGQKITRATFEPENMRGDFLPVAWEVIKFNLLPFFANLDFKSLGSEPAKASAQP